MHIIHLSQPAIDSGRAAFHHYVAASVCGPEAAVYDAGRFRDGGPGVIPGAILACIEQGMNDEESIVLAVASVSRCKRSTVWTVLDGLSGTDPDVHPWMKRGGRYVANRGEKASRPSALLVA